MEIKDPKKHTSINSNASGSNRRFNKHRFGERLRQVAETEDEVNSLRSSVSSRVNAPKKLQPIDLIHEYIHSNENCHANKINKYRREFGIYADCIGYSKNSIFFNENEKGTLSLRFSPDGRKVVAGFGSGTIKVFDSKSFALLNTLRVGKENGYGITCIRFLPKNNDVIYASSLEGTVVCYSAINDDLNVVINQSKSEINSIDINSTATELVTGGSFKDVKLYDIKTNALVKSYKNRRYSDNDYCFPEFHSNRVQAVKFHPDNPNIFLSGGWDKLLKMWDVRTKYGCIHTVTGPFISGDAIDIRDTNILTGSWEPNHTIKIWDFRTLKLIEDAFFKNAVSLSSGIYTFAVAYFDNDKTNDVILHASLGYKSLDVISIKQNMVMYSLFCDKSTVCIDSHGPHIVCGGTKNAFYFIDFFPNILVDYRDKPGFVEADENRDVLQESKYVDEDPKKFPNPKTVILDL